ncbi:hypothetical protein ACEPAF_7725 [Sanghuangporus sanghuang]
MIYHSYVGEVNTNLICCICHCPFLNPVVTTTCSHTFCRACIERTLEQQPCCPVDRSPLSLDDLRPENLLLRNMVDELIVECPHKAAGCKTTCQRQLLGTHLKETCHFVQVPCSEEGCEQTVLRRDLGKHTHDCVHRLLKCAACGTSVTASELEAHEHECAEQETECVACSGRCKRGELSGHTATCSELQIACAHSNHGCPWSGKRKTLSDHLEKCPYEAIKGFFAVNDTQTSALRDEITVLRRNMSKAEANIHALTRELAIARKALGPWWRSGDSTSPHISSSELTGSAAVAQASQGLSEQHRWRSSNPLAPILSFSPESSPISQSSEVESFSGNPAPPPPPAPSFTDPAFLAPFFPSDGAAPSPATLSPPPTVQVDPLTRHLFPFSNRFQSIYPPPPIRFPDLSPPSQPQAGLTSNGSSTATAAGGLPRVAPVDRSSTLEGALLGLRTSITAVSSALDALARRTDVALTTENLRMNEEVGALRAIVHGLRMQVHALITERNGSAWGAAGGGGGGGGAAGAVGPTTTTTTTAAYYNHPVPPPNPPPLTVNFTTQTQTTKL